MICAIILRNIFLQLCILAVILNKNKVFKNIFTTSAASQQHANVIVYSYDVNRQGVLLA